MDSQHVSVKVHDLISEFFYSFWNRADRENGYSDRCEAKKQPERIGRLHKWSKCTLIPTYVLLVRVILSVARVSNHLPSENDRHRSEVNNAYYPL